MRKLAGLCLRDRFETRDADVDHVVDRGRLLRAVMVAVVLSTAVVAGGSAAQGQEPREVASEEAPARGMGLQVGNARIHGYGDLHYNSPRGSDFPDRRQSDLADPHRFVIGVSYDWNENLGLEVEIDFEHAANAADLEFELGYIEYRHSPAVNVRAGALLMPVGPLNETHEPTTYYSVERPQIDNFIIPTTWQELGAGIVGQVESPFTVRYRAYVVSNLSAAGFSADQGIRGGRGKLKSQNTSGAALVGRLEFVPVLGLTLGASGYRGTATVFGTAHGISNAARLTGVGVTLWEGDVKYIHGPWEFTGRYGEVRIGKSVEVTAQNGTNNDPVAEKSMGWLTELALHTGQWLFPDSDRDLVAFARYQEIDTQDRVAAGFTRNLLYDRNITTLGLAFFPHPDVAFKADAELWKLATGAREDRYNLGVGFVY